MEKHIKLPQRRISNNMSRHFSFQEVEFNFPPQLECGLNLVTCFQRTERVWEGKNRNFIVENSGKHYLNQRLKLP